MPEALSVPDRVELLMVVPLADTSPLSVEFEIVPPVAVTVPLMVPPRMDAPGESGMDPAKLKPLRSRVPPSRR